jgi:hypothetical protein
MLLRTHSENVALGKAEEATESLLRDEFADLERQITGERIADLD